MPKLRIATFNCENLFSRPKVLNYTNDEVGEEPLKKLVALNTILAKPTYSAADKVKIMLLLGELTEYVNLNELKGKLISTHKVQGQEADRLSARLEAPAQGDDRRRNRAARPIQRRETHRGCDKVVPDRDRQHQPGVGPLRRLGRVQHLTRPPFAAAAG